MQFKLFFCWWGNGTVQYVSMVVASLWLNKSWENGGGKPHPSLSPSLIFLEDWDFYFLPLSITVPLPSSLYVLPKSVQDCHIQQSVFNIHHLFNCPFRAGISLQIGDQGKLVDVKLQTTMCLHSYRYFPL